MTKRMWHKETGVPADFGPDETPGPEYIDHHPEDTTKDSSAAPADPAPVKEPPPAADKPPAEKPMAKDEIVDALKAGGIEFDPKAKKDELEQLFISKLKAALADAEPPVEFTEDESARSLYGKLQAYLDAQAAALAKQE